MRIDRLNLIAAFLLLGCAFAAGTARSEAIYGGFPTLDVSARGTALGSSLVALTDDSEANTWNPAGLLWLGQRELTFSYADLFGLGLVEQTVAQFAWPILETDHELGSGQVVTRKLPPPAVRAFGFSVSNLSADALGVDYQETEVGLNFAWRTPGSTFAGVGVRFLWSQSSDGSVEASGQSFQVGLQRTMGQFRAGFLARDLISSLDWKEGTDDALPLRLALGLAWLPRSLPIRTTAEYTARGQADGTSRLGAAVEWDVVGPLTLRGGLRSTDDNGGQDVDWSSGLGFRWSELHVDYGFLESGNDLGTTHRWSASLGL